MIRLDLKAEDQGLSLDSDCLQVRGAHLMRRRTKGGDGLAHRSRCSHRLEAYSSFPLAIERPLRLPTTSTRRPVIPSPFPCPAHSLAFSHLCPQGPAWLRLIEADVASNLAAPSLLVHGKRRRTTKYPSLSDKGMYDTSLEEARGAASKQVRPFWICS